MSLINCEISLMLTWSRKYFCSRWYCAANQGLTFTITDTKIYVPVVTSSIRDNVKLMKQLELSIKRTINWNKYQSKIIEHEQNRYLDFLIDPNFQGVNRLFSVSFEDKNFREKHRRYFFHTVEIKDYSVMINGRNFY